MAALDSFVITKVSDDASSTFNKPPKLNYASSKGTWLTCRCYKLSVFRSRSALIVLLQSLSAVMVFNYLLNFRVPFPHTDSYSPTTIVIYLGVMLYTVIGLLGDVHYGRYRVVKCSFWFLWMTFIVYGLFLTLCHFLECANHAISLPVHIVFLLAVSLGLGGVQVNIMQFGIDQLLDASSEEIASFIRWYGWVWLFGELLTNMTYNCLEFVQEILIIATFLSIALCMDFFCNQWLVKEPVSSNPLTVVFRVIKYAAKNKYPSLRSSFSYWDDKKYSRLDLAKTTFGGPFSTEQVEDVKTFLRILVVLFVGSFFGAMIAYVRYADRSNDFDYCNSWDSTLDSTFKCNLKRCFWRALVANFGECFLVIFIPVFEFTLYPLVKRHFNGPSLKKFFAGMLLILFTAGGYGSLEAARHFHNLGSINHTNTSCLSLGHQPATVVRLDYLWLMMIGIVRYSGYYLLLIAAGEFLCAQSPYSLKGLLFGLAYGITGGFLGVNVAFLKLFELVLNKWFREFPLGCEALYFFVIFVALVGLQLVFFCAFKCYKARVRNDKQSSGIYSSEYS